jgi:hypothetical protein
LQKPNENVIYSVVGEESVQVKTEATESSPASEALQLIFADSGIDSRSIMLDLSKLLNDDPNLANQLAGGNNQTRISISAPTAPPMQIPKRSQMNLFTSEGMDTEDSSVQFASSYGAGSSYGASPQYTQVKQEPEYSPAGGLAMSGGQAIALSPSPQADYYNMQNAGLTLAQLNSPPNDDLTMLKTFGDLDSLNLDLEALTGDLLSGYPVEVST